MPQTVRLPDSEMADIRREAARQSRSLAGQIVHWVRIGRAMERSARFEHARVQAALDGRLSPDRLSGEEQEAWADGLDAALDDLGADPAVAGAYAALADD